MYISSFHENALNKIEQKLDFYAKYPNFRLFSEKKVYELHESVRSFLHTPCENQESTQKFHSNFIWKLKKYYRTPFQKEVVALVNANIKAFDLSDKDKLGYMNYLLSTKVYPHFHDSFFSKLAEVDLSKQENKLWAQYVFHKMKTLLAQKQKKRTEFVGDFQKFEPFLQNMAEQMRPSSYKNLSEFAEVYFSAVMNSEYKGISLKPIIVMMQNTSAMDAKKMPQLFDAQMPVAQAPAIDKKAVSLLMQSYRNFSIKNEKMLRSNLGFHQSIASMFCDIVKDFDYNANDVKNLRKILGTRHNSGGLYARLYETGLIVQRVYNQSHPQGVTPRHKTVQPMYKAGYSRWD